jgi:NADPH:quinone reductase-like Zn-dependent oxidoreductase
MKQIVMNNFGGPEKLVLETTRLREAASGEVVVKFSARD